MNKKILLTLFLFLVVDFVFAQSKEGDLFFSFRGRNLSANDFDFKEKILAKPNDEIEMKVLFKAGEGELKNIIFIFDLPDDLIFLKESLKINNQNFSFDITKGINLGNLLAGESKEISFRVKVKESALEKNFLFSSVKILANDIVPKRKTFIIEINKNKQEQNVLKPAGFIQSISFSINDPFSFSFVIAFLVSFLRELYFETKERIRKFFASPHRFVKTRILLSNFRIFIHRLFYSKK